MLNLKVIGAGAAGNKAAIELIDSGFNKDNVTLINSTSRDIPEEFKDISLIFGAKPNSYGGCGKERELGKKLIIDDMKNGIIKIDNIVDDSTDVVIIVSSTEGGSGSAVTPILAKYIKEVLGVHVITVLLFGFNSDVRGMQNSVNICQELQDNYGVIGISNAKFLDIANGNTLKAEELANKQFANIVRILSGVDIEPDYQNIDDTDLLKLVTTPGYMVVETTSVAKIKNVDQFNKTIQKAIDESTLIDCSEKGAKRIGLIFDNPNEMNSGIDFTGSVIKDEYGMPYEMYTHVQDMNKCTITWIVSGLPLPINEIKDIYEKYIENSKNVNKSKDSFFDSISELKDNEEDGMFDMFTKGESKTKSKASFFAEVSSTDAKTVKTKAASDIAEEYVK